MPRPIVTLKQQNDNRTFKRIENIANILNTYKEQILSEKNRELHELSIKHTLYTIVLESRTNSSGVTPDSRSQVEYIYI